MTGICRARNVNPVSGATLPKNVSCVLHNLPSNFSAGKTRLNIAAWEKITCDREILSYVKGVTLDLIADVQQGALPNPIQFEEADKCKMDKKIEEMLQKRIVEKAVASNGQFISNVFCRPKPDGSVRIILNLRNLNKDIAYAHFKMETLSHVLQLITPGCFMASVDLKDAYFSFPVSQSDRKYLRFFWEGELLEFTCLPNGLAEAPRKFTKALKAPFAWLRARGFDNSSYIDDSFLMGETYDHCVNNVGATISLLDDLGFTMHPEKSVLIPSHVLVYLGFVINSLLMSVTLTRDKVQKIRNKCLSLLNKRTCTIRELAELIGTLVAVEPGVDAAPLFIKRLEHQKDFGLKLSRGNFEGTITLDQVVKDDIQWWVDNVHQVDRKLLRSDPSVEITSDSSDFAWGGVRNGVSAGGPWSATERSWHINVKELIAAHLTLKTFCDLERNVHIRLLLDNSTSVSYINGFGGRKPGLNDVARKIWLWARDRNIWLTAVHLPGVLNVKADAASRKEYGFEGEWKLSAHVFQELEHLYGMFDIDLFASRINTQCELFFAWKNDPNAIGIDALLQRWNYANMYAFPPFSIIGRIIQKIAKDRVEVKIVLPLWPGQFWFARVLRMTVDHPRLLPKGQSLLYLPQDPQRVHSLWDRTKLTLFVLSGDIYRVKAFQSRLPLLLNKHGNRLHETNIGVISKDGAYFAVGEKLLHCMHL